MLAIVGGIVGCAIGWAGLRALVAALPPGIDGLDRGARSICACWWRPAILSVVTGVVFGLAPAIQTSNVDLATTLKESGRDGMAAGGAQRFRSALVTVQIGLALMLLIGAALMGNSLLKLLNNPLGADPKNLLTFEFRFPQDELMRPVDKYRGVGLWEIFPVTGLTFERVWERVQTIPGVRSAAAISRAPLSGNAMGMQFFIEGQARPESGRGQGAAYFAITPRYFETMRIPILRGRDFNRSDTASAPLVMIINKTMAERFWEGQDPIGQQRHARFRSQRAAACRRRRGGRQPDRTVPASAHAGHVRAAPPAAGSLAGSGVGLSRDDGVRHPQRRRSDRR